MAAWAARAFQSMTACPLTREPWSASWWWPSWALAVSPGAKVRAVTAATIASRRMVRGVRSMTDLLRWIHKKWDRGRQPISSAVGNLSTVGPAPGTGQGPGLWVPGSPSRALATAEVFCLGAAYPDPLGGEACVDACRVHALLGLEAAIGDHDVLHDDAGTVRFVTSIGGARGVAGQGEASPPIQCHGALVDGIARESAFVIEPVGCVGRVVGFDRQQHPAFVHEPDAAHVRDVPKRGRVGHRWHVEGRAGGRGGRQAGESDPRSRVAAVVHHAEVQGPRVELPHRPRVTTASE